MKILKLFPADPFLAPDEVTCARIVDHIVSLFPNREVDDGLSPLPQFIDCGDSLERVVCPLCGAELDSEDWACLMDSQYGEYGFDSLDVTVPCCGGATTLDKLRYEADCGFACFEIDVIEPRAIPKGLTEELNKRFGIPFHSIIAKV